MSGVLDAYAALLGDVKARIARAQSRAAVAANRAVLTLYWEIGHLLSTQREAEGWGARVIPRLADDLARELPDARGFSIGNLKRMLQFCRAYPDLLASDAIGAQPVLQLALTGDSAAVPDRLTRVDEAAAPGPLDLPWGHNILLIQKLQEPSQRAWYLQACVNAGWSRDVLGLMIRSRAHERSGAAVTNFATTLPAAQSDLAQQTVKDPYVFDFLTLDSRYRERELEAGLLAHLEHFLLELGVGFAFVGRQQRLVLDDEELFVDLLFYHLKLRCFVVVELKVGPFKAEYAGKMNLYLNVVDDTLRHPADGPSIGLILCQDKKRILAEYALRGLNKPIGVSEYELTRALPTELASTLPTIEAIETELSAELGP